MAKKQETNNFGPTLAPGIDDRAELEKSATKEELENGDFTSVTTLSLDEVDAGR